MCVFVFVSAHLCATLSEGGWEMLIKYVREEKAVF